MPALEFFFDIVSPYSYLASTRVRALDDEERVIEIARMLGGDPESSTSIEHARELLGRV